MATTKFDKMEDKVYGIFEKAEERRRASLQQAANILAEEKEKVDEMRRPAYKNMDENMVDMEGEYTEVRQVIRHRMADMEEKAADMARDMRRKSC